MHADAPRPVSTTAQAAKTLATAAKGRLSSKTWPQARVTAPYDVPGALQSVSSYHTQYLRQLQSSSIPYSMGAMLTHTL